MAELDELLTEVEKFGFDRSSFPLSVNGHSILLLGNDAKIEDGRLLFDISLFCRDCQMESDISGKFSNDLDNPEEYMSIVTVICFEEFLEPCP